MTGRSLPGGPQACPAGLAWGEKASRLKDTNSKHTSMPVQPTAAPLPLSSPLRRLAGRWPSLPTTPHHLQGTGASISPDHSASCTCCLRAGLLKIVNLLWLKDNTTHRCTAGLANTSSGMRHLCCGDCACLDLQVGPVQESSPSLTRGPPGPQGALPRDPSRAFLQMPARGLLRCLRRPTRRSQDCVCTESLPHLPIFPSNLNIHE